MTTTLYCDLTLFGNLDLYISDLVCHLYFTNLDIESILDLFWLHDTSVCTLMGDFKLEKKFYYLIPFSE